MRRQRRGVGPRLETLESLTLLSSVAALAAASPTAAEVAPTASTTLGGTLRGVFHEHQQGDLVILDYDIKAAGKLTPIGAATITGVLQEHPGTGDNGPGGTLLLSTSKGTLMLQMPRPLPVPDFSPWLPIATARNEIAVTYDIGVATGAYQDDTDPGVVDFYFTTIHSAKGIQTGRVEVEFTTMPTT